MAQNYISVLREEVTRYSKLNGSIATEFAPLSCECGGEEFYLFSDDESGAAFVECPLCDKQYDILNSREYAEEIVQNTCNCGVETLVVGVGVSKHENSHDIDWAYVGAHCRSCGLSGVYADWVER
ncbi:hypothetical protein [Roseovarius sp. 2305UL8-3]|uniref:hypothetical protein n=1 Tax=Roseovarius conchicola TaxID=3121636 RepID=UPI003526F81B